MTQPGLLLVDKPAGMTSHDVVAKIRKLAGTRKVGHAGTLDPMATGLLVLGIESSTKLLTFIVGATKTYEATIRLGYSTLTDDREGETLSVAEPKRLRGITQEQIAEAIVSLTGVIQQVPSAVSAIKVDGERAYARVRAGESVELKSREVTVSRFSILGEIRARDTYIDLDVIVDCSSGTYIRALARDLGNILEVGGHLTELRRTRVGNFDVADALTLSDAVAGELPIIPDYVAVTKILPVIACSEEEAVEIRQGKKIVGEVLSPTAMIVSGQLVAVLEQADPGRLKSLVVFEDRNV